MILTKAVKSTALALLKDKWFWGCVVALIPLFSMAAVYLLEAVLSVVIGGFAILIGIILNVFLTAVLLLGALRIFWLCANGIDEPVNNVFFYFSDIKRYKKAAELILRLLVPFLIGGAVLFLPSVIVLLVSSGKVFEWFNMPISVFGIGLKNLGLFLAVVAFIILLFKMLNLYAAAFIFVSNEEVAPKDCLKTALKISKCAKNLYTGHIFGYIGWILLSVFALPLIFTAPYLIMSYVVDCRYCVAYYNRIGEKLSSDPIYSY